MSAQFHILILADFNLQNFTAALRKTIPHVKVNTSPFGQLKQVLYNHEHEVWNNKYDLILIWLTGSIFQSTPFNGEEEAKNWVQLIQNSPAHGQPVYVTDILANEGFYGLMKEQEVKEIYLFNATIRKALNGINPLPWFEYQEYRDAKLWYLSKTPFHRHVFLKAAQTIDSHLNALKGYSKKMLILDLDDTLWGGIVGDEGWENLKLGGHDGVGEAYVDFQKEIKQLKDHGIILGIVSKNEESTALEAIRKHPEMILKEEDFSGWRINWNDKATNIAELVAEMNIGLDAVVFLDDNPLERERVRNALPQVFVPELPDDCMHYPGFLKKLSCFNSGVVTEEDRKKSELYFQEKLRNEEKVKFSNLDDWLLSLNTVITIEKLHKDNLPRATQLLNKTNQMNLRTRRLTEQELWSWAQTVGHYFFTVKVEDKLGNAGLTGLIGLRENGDDLMLEDFVLSCRVMGRKIEEALIAFCTHRMREMNKKRMIAEFLPTPKNNPCYEKFNSVYAQKSNVHTFVINEQLSYPNSIQVQFIF